MASFTDQTQNTVDFTDKFIGSSSAPTYDNAAYTYDDLSLQYDGFDFTAFLQQFTDKITSSVNFTDLTE